MVAAGPPEQVMTGERLSEVYGVGIDVTELTDGTLAIRARRALRGRRPSARTPLDERRTPAMREMTTGPALRGAALLSLAALALTSCGTTEVEDSAETSPRTRAHHRHRLFG